MFDQVSLDTLFSIPQRNGLTKPKRLRGEGVKMVNMGELFSERRIQDMTMDRVPCSERELESNKLEDGDLLFARQSLTLEGAGQSSIFLGDQEDVVFESHLIRCRLDKSKVEPLYYFYFFESKFGKQRIGSIVEQVAAAGIRGSDLVKLPVFLPPVSEQKAIAQILGTLDDKIELNQKMNKTLQEIAQAIFKSWFVDFDPVRAKAEGRPTGLPPEISDLFPDELVDSEIGEIPKGWDIAGLNDVSSNRSKSVKPEQMAQFSCYVGLEHLPRGHIFLSNWANPSDVASNKTVFEQGDILFGKLRPYFEKSVIAPNGGVCSTDIIAIKPNENAEVFVACLVSQKRFFEFTSQGSTGTRMPRTSWKHMCEFEFALPTDQLLKQFQSIMSPLVERAMVGISECETLSEIRDTLLPKLISGELRIPDAEKFLEEAGI